MRYLCQQKNYACDSKWEFNKLKYEWLIKMLSVYRENILILLEHLHILEQIFDSEVSYEIIYISVTCLSKKEELYQKEEGYILIICKNYWDV